MIVLDTHALFWWRTNDRRLTATALRAIESADRIIVPDIVCMEIAQLAHVGRIRLAETPRRWLELALAGPLTEVTMITPEIAVAAASLHQTLRGDPADAIISATALRLNAPLITRDERLRALVAIETIW